MCWGDLESASRASREELMHAPGPWLVAHIHIHIHRSRRPLRCARRRCTTYNLGTGVGYSVLEMLAAYSKVISSGPQSLTLRTRMCICTRPETPAPHARALNPERLLPMHRRAARSSSTCSPPGGRAM